MRSTGGVVDDVILASVIFHSRKDVSNTSQARVCALNRNLALGAREVAWK